VSVAPFIIQIMRNYFILLLLIVCCAPTTASSFEISDFAEDDYGAGKLIYPNRTDLRLGDLDLLSFSAENEDDGTWFTVRFRNRIRSPKSDGAVTEVGQVPIQRIARNGFYTFNVDVYIDQDMKPGSGRTESLPGRKIRIDPVTAWDKMVLLTPRPHMARSVLAQQFERIEELAVRAEQGRVAKEDRKRIAADVEARLDDEYFMPDRVRVRGREIKFFVPLEFLDTPASADWAYTVLVTGADLEQTAPLTSAPENFLLMNLPVERGVDFESFHLPGDEDPEQSPVVDYVNPRIGWQEAQLADYNLVKGIYSTLVGIVPSGRKLDSKAKIERKPPPPDPAPSASTERSAAARPPTSAAQESSLPVPTGTSLADRLRAVRALRDQGVLTEEEYQKIRRRIVSEY